VKKRRDDPSFGRLVAIEAGKQVRGIAEVDGRFAADSKVRVHARGPCRKKAPRGGRVIDVIVIRGSCGSP